MYQCKMPSCSPKPKATFTQTLMLTCCALGWYAGELACVSKPGCCCRGQAREAMQQHATRAGVSMHMVSATHAARSHAICFAETVSALLAIGHTHGVSGPWPPGSIKDPWASSPGGCSVALPSEPGAIYVGSCSAQGHCHQTKHMEVCLSGNLPALGYLALHLWCQVLSMERVQPATSGK